MSDDPRAAVVAAAVEWVAAHEELATPHPGRMSDPALLERYSDACVELLAVVSQNREVLVSEERPTAPQPATDGVGLVQPEERESVRASASPRRPGTG